MKRHASVLIAVVLAGAGSVIGWAATNQAPLAARQPAADPLVGQWDLNVGRTHYGGGAEPRTKESFDCTATGAAVTCSIHSVMADGRSVVAGFTATYDGPAGPTHGIPDVDHVKLARVSASIADATFTSQGKPVFGYRVVRSENGRSLTIVAVDPTSRAVLNSVVVYDQRPARGR